MNLSSSFLKQTAVGDLLNQGMLENVFQLREEPLLGYEFQTLKVEQIRLELLSHAHHSLQDTEGKFSSNH